MSKQPYSKVYWVSEKQKQEFEELIAKDFNSTSEGIRNIVLFYYAYQVNKEAEA